MNAMQQLGPDLPYGTVPGAPRSDGWDFFLSSPVFGRKMLQKSQKFQKPRAM